ncbi:uncharacterized protein LOC125228652 [Leguminivora glycinivorella]|uniref:uncharacterized protein LOC125228652 n=1 Tax=Leguminivora glycinivorella TaxID=1035111 RepID=UPI00200D15C2|nr:uncharacterized protein LOC125228652 [Leguminivora glycinivorella]
MKSRRPFHTASLLFLLHLAAHVCGTQFASHVSVNTPVHSFTHGVGDPLPGRGYQGHRSSRRPPMRPAQRPTQKRGYPRVKPLVPFDSEEIRGDGFNSLLWPYDTQQAINGLKNVDPVLPPSPYKVDSPDPESLWPEGLFLPPVTTRFGLGRRTDPEPEVEDPYLLKGSEAIAAVARARSHGVYYFHDIPHVTSLLANQELRAQNDLKPHRLGSIRHTWPFNRP